jgi:NADH:ubiquinone oxidoreductase subunit 6 (subunit J)
MEAIMAILKVIVIATCIVIGALFLAIGLGAPIPQIEYQGVTARDVPIGIAFLILAVALGKYWVISDETKTTRQTVTEHPDGTKTTVTDIVEGVKKMNVPPM